MLRVFLAHQLVGEFPGDHDHAVPENGGLEIVDPTGQVVKTYAAGEWHAAGENAVCGGMEPDPDCPRCGGTRS